jgi:hypothetical protein
MSGNRGKDGQQRRGTTKRRKAMGRINGRRWKEIVV